MSQPALSIVPIFATPLAVVDVPMAATVHESLIRLMQQRAATATGEPTSDILCYRGSDDPLEWTEPSALQVRDVIMRGIWSAVAALNTFTPEQLQALAMQARGTFTIVRPDGHLPATAYSLTAWCAIYCLEAPEASPDRPDSGVMRLYESRLTTTFADATSSNMRVPFMLSHYSCRLAPGRLVIFPGSLMHEIPLIRAKGPLTFITVRTRFVGPGQEGYSRW
jgi:hypothetical protein